MQPTCDSGKDATIRSQPMDVSLIGLNKFLTSFANKDTLAFSFQEFSRLSKGIFLDLIPSPIWAQLFAGSQTQMTNARSTFRWLLSVPCMVKLVQTCPWGQHGSVDHVLFVISQMGTILWHLFDHYKWLQQLRFLRGDPARSTCISFSCFSVGQFVAAMHYFPLSFYKPRATDSPEESTKKHIACWAARNGLYRSSLYAIAFAHIGNLMVSNDIVCGAFIVVVTSMNMYDAYPRKLSTCGSGTNEAAHAPPPPPPHPPTPCRLRLDPNSR
jgi:hypothetical protein